MVKAGNPNIRNATQTLPNVAAINLNLYEIGFVKAMQIVPSLISLFIVNNVSPGLTVNVKMFIIT